MTTVLCYLSPLVGVFALTGCAVYSLLIDIDHAFRTLGVTT